MSMQYILLHTCGLLWQDVLYALPPTDTNSSYKLNTRAFPKSNISSLAAGTSSILLQSKQKMLCVCVCVFALYPR